MPSFGTGQNPTTFFGKILCIDVNKPSAANGTTYTIPPTNPIAGGATELTRPEIFAYGFRDPNSMSFDSADNHLLFASNDGQDLFDSVDIVVNDGDYGWNIREGTHCFNTTNPSQPEASCAIVGPNQEPLGKLILSTLPAGWSSNLPAVANDLTAADLSMWETEVVSVATNPGGNLGAYVLGFGEDDNHELYLLTSQTARPSGATGKVYKLVPAGS